MVVEDSISLSVVMTGRQAHIHTHTHTRIDLHTLCYLRSRMTAAVVRSDGVIVGEALASQSEIHQEWGGVVPSLARDAHEAKIDAVVEEALQNAGLESVDDVDAVAVTVGPGLEICLRVGCRKGQALALQHQKPFVGVHHLEAHILMARLPDGANNAGHESTDAVDNGILKPATTIEFPFLALLVSGGHCQIMKCLGIGRYIIVGGTIDDSLGMSFTAFL